MKNLRRAQRNERHTQISDNQFPYLSQREGRNRSKDFHNLINCFFLAYHAHPVINAGTDKIIFFLHAACENLCFDFFPLSGRDTETDCRIVERLQEMENRLVELAEQIDGKNPGITSKEIRDLREAYEDMLKAILWMLDGARYLWQGEEKSPDSGNC